MFKNLSRTLSVIDLDRRRASSWGLAEERRAIFYASFISEGDLVFDIGANLGNRTKVFRHLGARVIALEPQPYCQSILRHTFRDDPKIILLEAAVGSRPGTMPMLVSTNHMLSSFSTEWVDSVKASERFGPHTSWRETIACNMTTLDILMSFYGIPSFVKIDVEGYELPVLEGMHCAVKALSFEFTPECVGAAFRCIDRLDAMRMSEFNYSAGEAMELSGAWRDGAQMKADLEAITDNRSFGDVYARFAPY